MAAPYYTWRPWCGASLLIYALELRQKATPESLALLRDLYNQTRVHAKNKYNTDSPSLAPDATPEEVVRDITMISCRVRGTKKWQQEVNYITNVEEFSDLLAQAFKYMKDEPSADVRKAKMDGFHIVCGCHNDGSLFLEKHVPVEGGRPHRRVYFFVGILHQLLCDFTQRHPQYLNELYTLLQQTMGHGGGSGEPKCARQSADNDTDAEEASKGSKSAATAEKAAAAAATAAEAVAAAAPASSCQCPAKA